MYKNNTTGYTGVYTQDKGVTLYFVATWHDLNKVAKAKCFNTKRYGVEEALRLAVEHRAKMIEELNLQGAGYTERHGGAK